MEDLLRKEKYYGVFDYDDELTPGVELKIGHIVIKYFFALYCKSIYKVLYYI